MLLSVKTLNTIKGKALQQGRGNVLKWDALSPPDCCLEARACPQKWPLTQPCLPRPAAQNERIQTVVLVASLLLAG